MKYNERIREIREERFLTQQKVADLLHVGQRTYADYESGKIRIPIDNIMILARFYNVSMDYITGASNVRTKYPKEYAAAFNISIMHSSDNIQRRWKPGRLPFLGFCCMYALTYSGCAAMTAGHTPIPVNPA